MSEKRIRELESRIEALEKAIEEIKDATWEPGATLAAVRKRIGEILGLAVDVSPGLSEHGGRSGSSAGENRILARFAVSALKIVPGA
jgi:hypothetical protein